MNMYVGHPSQLSGVEEVSLLKGKGKGTTLLNVNNGNGLFFTLNADRCMDVSRIYLNGTNFGYFSATGYVAPAFYDDKGAGFLKSFTAGFLTTCGLTAVGSPCTDNGEELPLHGRISHTPCDSYNYREDEEQIIIEAVIREATVFGSQMQLERKYVCKKKENVLQIFDKITNIGSSETPCMILYHCNIGYPLLSENAFVNVPNTKVAPRNDHAATDIKNCLNMEKPTQGYEEMCFYFDVKSENGKAGVGIYNPDIKKGLVINYDINALPCFTEWKMMGQKEYVLGLEPGNCTPDGRDVLREKGMLKFLKPGESYETSVSFEFVTEEEKIKNL